MAPKKAKRAKLSNMAPLFGDCELFTVVVREGYGVIGGRKDKILIVMIIYGICIRMKV